MVEVRRIVTIVEDVMIEGGSKAEQVVRRVASAAVITNPAVAAGGTDIGQFIAMGTELGTLLAEQAMSYLGGGERVDSFGKGCIVGEGGELEQAAALIHPTYGRSVRQVIGGGKAGIPSTKKVAGIGASIDVPLSYRDNAGVVSHFDTMTVTVPGSPKADEIVVVLALTNGGRPHPRIPGTQKAEVK
jgi:hypothetical protein